MIQWRATDARRSSVATTGPREAQLSSQKWVTIYRRGVHPSAAGAPPFGYRTEELDPAAIALQLAHPGRPVLNVTGDGAFGFSVQELDTARRLKVPVINVVHNNGDWGIIRFAYSRAGTQLDDNLAGADYAAIARGFGCHGEIVTRAAELGPALERSLASGLPAVLDCRVRFEPHPGLPDFAKMSGARSG